jgi:cytoskeletal protein RodZ
MVMTEFKQSGYGAVLRQRREELGLSLNDLAASTRVRKTYLQALEEENLQMLPGAAYSVGFLRIYARQLGLPIEPLLAALAGNETLTEQAPRQAHGGDLPSGTRKGSNKRKTGKLLLLLFLLLLAAAGYLYYRKAPKLLRPAPVLSPEVSSPARPAQKPVAELPVAVQPTAIPATAQNQPAIVPTELPVIPAAGAIVRMLPLAAGTMKVSLDNQEVREYQLQPDQSLNWKVSTSLAVELSAPGLARVWVDQQEIAVTEQAAFILKAGVKTERRP